MRAVKLRWNHRFLRETGGGGSRINAHPKDSSLTPKIDVVDCTSMDANVNGIRHSCSEWSPTQIPDALNLKPRTPDRNHAAKAVTDPRFEPPIQKISEAYTPKPCKSHSYPPTIIPPPNASKSPNPFETPPPPTPTPLEAISTSTPTSSRTSTSWSPKAPPPIGGAAGGPGGAALLWGAHGV